MIARTQAYLRKCEQYTPNKSSIAVVAVMLVMPVEGDGGPAGRGR